MKLSISNIAWGQEHDTEMYEYISAKGVSGLEIAPTRLFPKSPYDHIAEAKHFSKTLFDHYGLTISSMQSIWYGKTASIFGTSEDRRSLYEYTKSAIRFAEAMGCRNLVFGCPKNRNLSCDSQRSIAIDFFREIGEYALEHNTVVAIEPNPPYYGTNFINTTCEAFEVCKEVGSKGIRVNLDIGTMIYFRESLDDVRKNIDLVNHIHISEPELAVIKKRSIHRELLDLNYSNWYSIEMKNTGDIGTMKDTIDYIAENMGG
jgi:sugar phosphate isomerase/epimerase